MLLYVFAVFLVIDIAFLYYYNDRDFFSPVGLCCLGFFFATISSIYNIDTWYFDMKIETFFVLSIGIISISLGFIFSSRLFKPAVQSKQYFFYNIKPRQFSYCVFLLLQAVVIFLMYNYIMETTTGDTLAEHLFMFRLLDLAGETEIPSYITIPYLFCQWSVYVFAYKFILDYACYKKINFPSLAIIILNLFLNFLSAAKGPIIWFFMGIFMIIWVTYSRKKKWDISLSFTRLLKLLLLFLGGLILLVALAFLLGRESTESMTDTQILAYIAEYLSIYLGAELKLLDNFLTTFFYTYSPNWMGYASFHFLYSWLGTKFDIPYWVQNNSTDLLDYGAVNQVLLGNVYTCFSIYFLDFGFLGIVILPFIMGGIFGAIYSYIRYVPSKTNRYGIDFTLLIYSNIIFTIALSFFSDCFFSYVFSPWMLKGVVSLYIAQIVFLKRRGGEIDVCG